MLFKSVEIAKFNRIMRNNGRPTNSANWMALYIYSFEPFSLSRIPNASAYIWMFIYFAFVCFFVQKSVRKSNEGRNGSRYVLSEGRGNKYEKWHPTLFLIDCTHKHIIYAQQVVHAVRPYWLHLHNRAPNNWLARLTWIFARTKKKHYIRSKRKHHKYI